MALISDAYFENVEDVWMEDLDGSGFSLTIPGMMIAKDDGYKLEEAVKKGQTVTLQAQLEISHSISSTVELSLWYGSILDLPNKLIEELYDYIHLLKSNLKFTPRIMTI